MEKKIKRALARFVKELTSKHEFHVYDTRKGYQELGRGGDFVAILTHENEKARIIAGPCTSPCPGTFWIEGESFDMNDIISRINRRLGDVK